MRIRDVEADDLEAFFEHQRDPEAVRMAAVPARGREAFMAHWAKVRADETAVTQAVVVASRVVGNVVSWDESSRRYVGYWIDRSVWGRGIATKALGLFFGQVTSPALCLCRRRQRRFDPSTGEVRFRRSHGARVRSRTTRCRRRRGVPARPRVGHERQRFLR